MMSFVVQLMNGISRIVNLRSRSDGSVRVAMTAATVQPKPVIIGTMELPDRPILRSARSMKNAARAM